MERGGGAIIRENEQVRPQHSDDGEVKAEWLTELHFSHELFELFDELSGTHMYTRKHVHDAEQTCTWEINIPKTGIQVIYIC